ncbi:MAG: 6-carboxytetrahydropterin synthase [Sedimentisphaerales bacterium]|nr:6-carboxytetrahydropterin synthase [Sedimentisphaerales bacterium]
MYSITATTTFNASHQLKLSGAAEPVHSHEWIVKAALGGRSLDENDMLFDFNKLKKILDDSVSLFTDKKLEDCACFKDVNASAENVARYVYDEIKKSLPEWVKLLYVEVTEMPGFTAKYSENKPV